MFTIKYISRTGQETLSGPYSQISVEWVDGAGEAIQDPQNHSGRTFVVVHCHDQRGDPALTLGPNLPPDGQPEVDTRPAKVFVMNEAGATVSRYIL